MFADRTEAGERLAEYLASNEIRADIVLAVPRGGLPVGRMVTDHLDIPLDIIAARKIGAPHNPELAIGAVSSGGSTWLNDSLIDELGVDDDYIKAGVEREQANAQAKIDRYRTDRTPLDLVGKSVLIVDDGVATGATTIACIREARDAGAESVRLAVPVAPPDSIDRLDNEADEVLVLEAPSNFNAVGQFYRRFDQVTDEEAMTYLD